MSHGTHEILLLLSSLNMQLLEERHVGGNADDCLFVRHLVGAEHLVDQCGKTRDVTDVTVDDNLFLEVERCRGIDTDSAVILYICSNLIAL